MEGGNLLRTPVSIQLVLQQPLKQRVIAEPSVFRVQGDQEKVVLSDPPTDDQDSRNASGIVTSVAFSPATAINQGTGSR